MQCPECGYDADDAVIFCPQCRFQFRDQPGEPVRETGPGQVPSHHDISEEETFFEASRPALVRKSFTGKELRQMEIQLLQPAMLVVLIIALFSFTVLASVPFIPLTIAGLSFGVTGIVSLACGLVGGIIFFLLARSWIRKYR